MERSLFMIAESFCSIMLLSLLTEVAEKLNYLSPTSLTRLSILSHISNRIFPLKYPSIPSLLCARCSSRAKENEGIRCSLMLDGNEWDFPRPTRQTRPPISTLSGWKTAVNLWRNPLSPVRRFTINIHGQLWNMTPCHGYSFLAAAAATVEGSLEPVW